MNIKDFLWSAGGKSWEQFEIKRILKIFFFFGETEY